MKEELVGMRAWARDLKHDQMYIAKGHPDFDDDTFCHGRTRVDRLRTYKPWPGENRTLWVIATRKLKNGKFGETWWRHSDCDQFYYVREEETV